LVARLLWEQDVVGSNPVTPIFLPKIDKVRAIAVPDDSRNCSNPVYRILSIDLFLAIDFGMDTGCDLHTKNHVSLR
jgi:hypothetical protein